MNTVLPLVSALHSDFME